MVQIFDAVGEWILGNTFSRALFFPYGKIRFTLPKK
jgi:succinate-acetate transporter protein